MTQKDLDDKDEWLGTVRVTNPSVNSLRCVDCTGECPSDTSKLKLGIGGWMLSPSCYCPQKKTCSIQLYACSEYDNGSTICPGDDAPF